MIGALELGLIYAVMAVGVYLTFRVLDFPDLTVDGSFTSGAATAGVLITNGVNPFLASLAGFCTGFVAGCITGLLHTKGRIDGLLAGILTMIGLWSINLRIMGSANVPLLTQDSVFTPLDAVMGTWAGVGLLAVGAVALCLLIVWFLSTDLGMSLRATGDNQQMITSFGVSTDFTKVLTLAKAATSAVSTLTSEWFLRMTTTRFAIPPLKRSLRRPTRFTRPISLTSRWWRGTPFTK